MLIEVPFKDGDVVTLKLLGGDELVAKLVETSGITYKLKHILVVAMSQNGFGLMPFMVTVDHGATHAIDISNVVAIHKTHSEITKQYIKQTSNLIV